MFDPSATDTVSRFDGLADLYDRYRPDYPDAAIEHVRAQCQLMPGCRLIDVGCGTGIASRRFAACGLEVIGIEPNNEMRRQAELDAVPPDVPPPEYRTGKAEATGLPGEYADAVLAAQAFHWFDVEPALREFLRILKPGGWLALIWNERDRRDTFTKEYGQILRQHSSSVYADAPQSDSGEHLLRSSHYTNRKRVEFTHSQEMDFHSLLGRSFSISFSPREPEQRERFVMALRNLFDHFQSAGRVTMKYLTVVYTGRKPLVVPASR
ncbi:MAG TPA: class I SAM-dependent methyltransferase [Gemmataceae bacterium]|jgi:ubiquinone/menaquinone biosynthesis C-methylase UbiE|nr:class I SAM-dependent methyltransferase [Gemmataceae bacterium]